MSALELILLPGLIVLIIVLHSAAKFVLGPALEAAQKIQAPLQFQIVDFFYLSIQVQLAIAPIAAFVSRQQPLFFRAIIGFGFLAAIGLWAGSVQFLSSAGVRTSLKRAVFILVYLPGALAVTIGFPLLGIVNVIYISEQYAPGMRDWLGRGLIVLNLLAIGAIVATAFALRRLGLWLVRDAIGEHRIHAAIDPNANTSADAVPLGM